MWDKIKNFFSGKPSGASQSLPEIRWIDSTEKDNPFKVNLLDVQPVTRHTTSWSEDTRQVDNLGSYTCEDGSAFINDSPPERSTVSASLRYPIDRALYGGQFFVPGKMEHKWAIFFQQGKILFVRSWLRQVVAVANCKIGENELEVTSITGSLTGGVEENERFRVRVADFLIRSHVLRMGELAPIPLFLSLNPKAAALWCMNIYGEYAVFATPFEYQSPMPIPRPLRTTTLLHLNAQRGDVAVVDKCLASGLPIDVLANDGFAPLHWALLSSKPEMTNHLIDRGSPVDVRSHDGATALMMVIQSRSIEMCRLLLERGADPNAVDHRGFSSLHRACEMGQFEIVQMLLSRGAKKDLVALGQTARDLAVQRKETKVIELLDN